MILKHHDALIWCHVWTHWKWLQVHLPFQFLLQALAQLPAFHSSWMGKVCYRFIVWSFSTLLLKTVLESSQIWFVLWLFFGCSLLFYVLLYVLNNVLNVLKNVFFSACCVFFEHVCSLPTVAELSESKLILNHWNPRFLWRIFPACYNLTSADEWDRGVSDLVVSSTAQESRQEKKRVTEKEVWRRSMLRLKVMARWQVNHVKTLSNATAG